MSEDVVSLIATGRPQFARSPLLEARGAYHRRRFTQGRRVLPTVLPDSFQQSCTSLLIAAVYALGLVCLHVAWRHFDLCLAYAIWTGSGAAVLVLMGVVELHEPIRLERALWISVVVFGVVALIRFEAPLGSSELFRLQRLRELPREHRPVRPGIAKLVV